MFHNSHCHCINLNNLLITTHCNAAIILHVDYAIHGEVLMAQEDALYMLTTGRQILICPCHHMEECLAFARSGNEII